jgi:peroxiredoxin
MEGERIAGWGVAVGLCCLAVGAGGRMVCADQIKLKDGAEFTATMLQKDGESVIVQLPRSSVASVNGQSLPPPVAEGFAAPDFSAVDLSGATHSLTANRGQVVLLKFWATWCPHCRSDVSYMKELDAKYQGKGARILTVSVDQSLDDLNAFIGKERLPYPVISAVTYPEVADRYEVQGIPAYRLIDAKGMIVKTWAGSLTEGDANGKSELDTLLASLLKQ